MKETVETRVSQTVLNEPKTVLVAGRKYRIAAPTTGTLIKVSELVSQLPIVEDNDKNPIEEALRVAKDCKVLPDIFAILILGARKPCRSFFGEFIQILYKKRIRSLSDRINYKETPQNLSKLLSNLLAERMDIGFFLGITSSLSGVNVTKPTKTTASGQL